MSVNSKMTAIADAIRAKTGGTSTLTLDQMATEIAGISGGGAEINVIAAASLPAAVTDGQIVVITDTTPTNIYLDTNEPANPVSGDIWIVVAEGDYKLPLTEETPFCNLGLNGAKQYNGNDWIMLDGYIGVNGEWQRFALSLPAIGTPLADWTWAQIIALCNAGGAVSQYFAVGDEKDIVLTTGEIVTVAIGAFDHNTITGTERKAPLAFTFKNCLQKEDYAINTTGTNAGGWDSCNMRTTHMPAIFATFPPELQADNAVKYVDVVASAGSKSTALVTSSDRLRLHSVTELGLASSHAVVEGEMYYFYSGANRIKTANGKTIAYWTRSPNVTGTGSFCAVDKVGSVTLYDAFGAGGTSCCFDI